MKLFITLMDAVPAGRLPRTEISGATAALVCTLADVERWLSTAELGSTVAYHRGYLALDRGAGSRFGEDAGEELDHIASAMLARAEAGDVHLLQRRHGSCVYTYLAVTGRAGGRRGSRRRIQECAS